MKEFIVQARFTTGAKLVSLGVFVASDELHAVLQAAKVLARNEENAFELIATEKDEP